MTATTADLLVDDDIVRWIVRAAPRLVAIDAPLTLPPGRRHIEDRRGGHLRDCDVELLRRGIRFFPVTLGPMRQLTCRGIALSRALERYRITCVEVFPGGAQDLWGIGRKQDGLERLRLGLVRLGVRGLSGPRSGDELDAVTCALVGRLHELGETEVYGDACAAPFVMPLGARAASRA